MKLLVSSADLTAAVNDIIAYVVKNRREIDAAGDPAVKRQALIDGYNEKFMNPYVAAAHGYVDEVILPEETRRKIVSAFDMLKEKKKALPKKKHGNIPL